MDIAAPRVSPAATPANLATRFGELFPGRARLAALLVAPAGITAGVFAWYVLATHRIVPPDADPPLFILALASLLIAISYWLGYSAVLARFCAADFLREYLRQRAKTEDELRDLLETPGQTRPSAREQTPAAIAEDRHGVTKQAYEEFAVLDALSFVPLFGLLLVFAPGGAQLPAPALLGGVTLLHVMARLAVLAYYLKAVRVICAVFLATRVPLMIIAPLANIVLGERQGIHWSPGHGVFLDVWTRWDGQHYLAIAQSGYHGNDVAFFPFYPLLIWGLGWLVGDHAVAGVIISNVAFFVALAFLYALVKLEFGNDETAFHAVFYISIFPTAAFFSTVYTESVFLALTLACIYFARRGNLVTAGIFGALASATRIEGVLLVLPLAYEVWHAWRERRGTSLARGLTGLALVPAGLLAYMTYLYVLTGDALAFHHVQSNWNRHLAPPWTSVINSVREITRHSLASSTAATHMIELTFTAAFLILLVFAIRRLRPTYWLYFAASMLVPMCTASLMSMPRFVLVVFPAFMLLALWGHRPVVNSAIVSLFLPLLGLFTVFFADWYWLA